MASVPQLHELLSWSTSNTQAGAEPPKPRSDLNPEIIDHILGKSDAVRMRECVEFVGDYGKSKEERLQRWDDLELLVENLDNANDLSNMNLWPPIVSHLSANEDEVKLLALWVSGTAIQNNPKAQSDFLRHNPLPIVLSIITSTTDSQETRAKAMYCLSSALRHSDDAVNRFIELDGFSALDAALKDSSLNVRRKAAFLITSLFINSPTPQIPILLSSLRQSIALSTLLTSLSPSESIPTGPDGDERPDEDYLDKAWEAVVRIVQRSEDADRETEAEAEVDEGSVRPEPRMLGLEEGEKGRVRKAFGEGGGVGYDRAEAVGVSREEWDAFRSKIGV